MLFCAPVAVVSALAQDGAAKPSGMSSNGDFSVGAVITTERNWLDRWVDAVDAPPQFVAAQTARVGDRVSLVVMFDGASAIESRVQVNCAFELAMPDGTYSQMPPSLCFDQPHQGHPDALSLISLNMGFDVEPTSPSGRYWYFVTAMNPASKKSASVAVSVDVEVGRNP
jgi:hypothetical protein